MSLDPASSLRFPAVRKLELDELIDQLVERAQEVKRTQGRLRALLRAIDTVAGDLSLETVLRNVVEAGCELAEAKYGALGVIGYDGGLEQFIHVGIDEATAERIGHLPQGNGLLGALITDPRPIRLRRMADDPRSTGFPPHHPPMQSFIGVPIHVWGEVYGNLYLADSAAGEFSAEDEELVGALAYAAGAAISNARLYQESRLQQRWLQASVEIGAQMLSSSGEDPLRLIGRRALELADADLVGVSLLTPDRQTLVVEVAFGPNSDQLIGRHFAVAETAGSSVVDSGQPLLLADSANYDGPMSYLSDSTEAGPLMVLPLQGTGQPRGTSACSAIAAGGPSARPIWRWRPASPRTPASRWNWRTRVAPNSGWCCWRTATGSRWTCTITSSRNCSPSVSRWRERPPSSARTIGWGSGSNEA
jgi:hypothetical protein